MLDGATIGVIAKRMCKRCRARRMSVWFLCVCERAAGSVGSFRAGRTQWKHLGEKGEGKRVTGKRAAVNGAERVVIFSLEKVIEYTERAGLAERGP